MSDTAQLATKLSEITGADADGWSAALSAATPDAIEDLTALLEDPSSGDEFYNDLCAVLGGSLIIGSDEGGANQRIIAWTAPTSIIGVNPTPTDKIRQPVLDPAVGSAVNDEAAVMRHNIDQSLRDQEMDLGGVFSLVENEDSPHRPIGHMHLRRVLLDLPHIGEVRADAILADLGLEADRHLASLGSHQMEALELAAAEFTDTGV